MNFDRVLAQVTKPSRYCGNEFNVIKKEWDTAALRMVLAFPDLYEIGMSHQGLQILYHLVNRQPGWLAERVYAPDRDLEELLRAQGLPLFSLESRRPLAEFDILGITLPYELCYTNILTILDLAGMPFKATARDERFPLVLGGGPCAFHPEPVADFFDAILLGDGEEAIVEIADCVATAKAEGLGREELLHRLATIAGIYVPRFFEPRYDGAGAFAGVAPLRPGYTRVRRRVLPSLGEVPVAEAPLVPTTRIVHDRLGIEIARGCTRGCRFCQAGIIYRPVRERSPEQVLELAQRGIEATGFEEMALLSLSTGDYACLGDLLVRLMDLLVPERVSVSMPSLRVGTLTPAIMEQIRRVRKTGFTLAPEAGTDRLRQVINKGITEEDLLAATTAAFRLGWKLIKLYFMCGLPTETEEDLAAIPELAWKVLRTSPGGGRQVTVSAAVFVPKPHTVFEREPQLGIEEGLRRLHLMRDRLKGRSFSFKWHDPRQSYLEGVLCRGDRRLSAVLEAAWQGGARLDAWSDFFNLDLWRQAALGAGIDLDRYLARREPGEPLPWDHLDAGVRPEFLAEELAKAHKGEYTPDCRVHGCQGCGLCDFKTVKPVVYREADAAAMAPAVAVPSPRTGEGNGQPEKFVYRLDYARQDEARLLSHLELIQVIFRAFRRAHLPLHYSQGFNPTPKVSFGPALPLGTASLAEYLYVELTEPLGNLAMWQARLNQELPAGLTVEGVALASGDQPQRLLQGYEITLPRPPEAAAFERLLNSEQFVITVLRKGQSREIDVRPQLHHLAVRAGGVVELAMWSETGRAAVKPMELLREVLALPPQEVYGARIVKVWSREEEQQAVRTCFPAACGRFRDGSLVSARDTIPEV